MPDTDPDERPPFHKWLAAHREGLASEEWADALADLVAACHETGKPGTLTFTIAVAPKGRTLVVTDTIKAKPPQYDREAAVYFRTRAGGLSRRDPDQATLDLAPVTNLRAVPPDDMDAETGEAPR